MQTIFTKHIVKVNNAIYFIEIFFITMNIQKEKMNYPNSLWQWKGDGLKAPVLVLDEVDSVLDDAWNLVKQNNFPIWSCVLARSQNKGRGQTRREWQSPSGNIYAALRLPNEQVFANTCAAPALSALIIKALTPITCNLGMKWPNDLVDIKKLQKVGGILLEEKQDVIIAGIGINLEYAPSTQQMRMGAALNAGVLNINPAAHSILRSYDKNIFQDDILFAEKLWLYLVSKMYFCYTAKLPMLWADLWQKEAEKHLLWKGKFVSITDTDTKVFGILNGISSTGELELLVDGQKQYFLSGNLSYC